MNPLGTLLAAGKRALEFPRFYRSWQSLVGADQMRRLYIYEHLRPKHDDVIVDIGCGTGEIVDYIPEGRYLGLDNNPAYIEAAAARHSSRGEFRLLRVRDAFLPELAGKSDLAMAIGILHHLDDQEADYCMALAYALLKPGGRFVTIDGVFHPKQGILRRCVLRLDRGRHVRSRAEYRSLASAHFSLVTDYVYDNLTRIPSSFLVMECTKPLVLKD
jgi:SAM-dependent methyltransferase